MALNYNVLQELSDVRLLSCSLTPLDTVLAVSRSSCRADTACGALQNSPAPSWRPVRARHGTDRSMGDRRCLHNHQTGRGGGASHVDGVVAEVAPGVAELEQDRVGDGLPRQRRARRPEGHRHAVPRGDRQDLLDLLLGVHLLREIIEQSHLPEAWCHATRALCCPQKLGRIWCTRCCWLVDNGDDGAQCSAYNMHATQKVDQHGPERLAVRQTAQRQHAQATAPPRSPQVARCRHHTLHARVTLLPCDVV